MLHIKVFDNAEEDEGNDMVLDVNEWVIVEFSINTNKKISRWKADDGNFLEAQFYKADDAKSSRGHWTRTGYWDVKWTTEYAPLWPDHTLESSKISELCNCSLPIVGSGNISRILLLRVFLQLYSVLCEWVTNTNRYLP